MRWGDVGRAFEQFALVEDRSDADQGDQAVGYASQNMGLGLGEADGMLLVDAAVDQLC